jgi:hypothetical protein
MTLIAVNALEIDAIKNVSGARYLELEVRHAGPALMRNDVQVEPMIGEFTAPRALPRSRQEWSLDSARLPVGPE